ncbi:hypothetical protein, partial [Staphylococcus coagulans]|uniref:hypothetical protein n=1 Tax=Staphylococcus coagulans TaxID=74706 RepID=UPI001BE86341
DGAEGHGEFPFPEGLLVSETVGQIAEHGVLVFAETGKLGQHLIFARDHQHVREIDASRTDSDADLAAAGRDVREFVAPKT